jgi:cell division septation protein DedD
MVQIGAFKVARNASRVQTTARSRYHLPVLNDYNTAHALYQIRIGFFETKDDAYKFRQQMQLEHPADYKDAWVVQLRR